jgi:hypothetical protein
MTDDRPRPKYGEYAPIAPAPVVVEAPAPAVEAPAEQKPRNVRDLIITTVLLLLAVADVTTSFSLYANLAVQVKALVYVPLGIPGDVTSTLAEPVGLAINIARVTLLVVTIVVSLLLIARRRRAFWVPLAGYALAGLVSTILVFVVLADDPAYTAWMTTYQ